MMTKPMKSLELHYPMIQFFIIHGITLESIAELVYMYIHGSKKKLNSNLPFRQLAVTLCLLWASQVALFH